MERWLASLKPKEYQDQKKKRLTSKAPVFCQCLQGVMVRLYSKGVDAMKTKTTKFMGKTVAVYGQRKRVEKNRYGLSFGSTFTGLHLGKTSRYLSIPFLSKRKFGGVRDIVKVS